MNTVQELGWTVHTHILALLTSQLLSIRWIVQVNQDLHLNNPLEPTFRDVIIQVVVHRGDAVLSLSLSLFLSLPLSGVDSADRGDTTHARTCARRDPMRFPSGGYGRCSVCDAGASGHCGVGMGVT
jgi:hypothetical protein